MSNFLIDPKKEFLIVRHSYLNGNTYVLENVIEETLSLENQLNGRKAVLCLEGDVLQVEETGEVVLTHQNFRSLSRDTYRQLRERQIAASLHEVLEKIAAFRDTCPEQRVVLCFEPKAITKKETIDATVQALTRYSIVDAYFDSFFGSKLDLVAAANTGCQTNYGRSLHLSGNIGSVRFPPRWLPYFSPAQGYDIVTVPKKVSFGDVGEPVIYGAVGDVETLRRVAERPNVSGAYVRLKEGKGVGGALKMFWNSVTNRESYRKITKN